jgi:phage terminase small subunit
MGEKFDAIKNIKHKNFILEYVKCQNATLAYSRAYPSSKIITAGQNGHQLLKNTKISDAIQEIFNDLWKDKQKKIGETFENLLNLANADIKSVVDYQDGELTIKNFDETDTRIIQSIDVTKEDTKYGEKIVQKVRMHPKTSALSDLLKVLEMMQDKSELTGEIIVRPAVRPDEENTKETE